VSEADRPEAAVGESGEMIREAHASAAGHRPAMAVGYRWWL